MQLDRYFRPLEHIVRTRDPPGERRLSVIVREPVVENVTAGVQPNFGKGPPGLPLVHFKESHAGSLAGNLKVGKNKVEGMSLKDRGAAVL